MRRAVVVATRITGGGDREVLGLSTSDSEDTVFWTEFLRTLRERGLSGIQLVISASHLGLRSAIDTVFVGASWQRCRVHFVRNVLARMQKSQATLATTAVRSIFAQGDATHVHRQLRDVAEGVRSDLPVLYEMLEEAEADLTAFASFPSAYWRKLWSTNPLERVNAEIKRRSRVEGVFRRRHTCPQTHYGDSLEAPRRVALNGPPHPLRGLHGAALSGPSGGFT